MPSPVPAGYTRGPILYMAPAPTREVEHRLLQRFWQEAGGYGGRVLILACGTQAEHDAERVSALFRDWESESVGALMVRTRADAVGPEATARVHAATAILLCGHNALRLAGVLGGTDLAQAIRRANAQNKAIGALGAGGAVICQHMTVPGEPVTAGSQPFLSRSSVRFAPGLGLVNRLTLDAAADEGDRRSVARLLAAVAFNPFLAAAAADPGTGFVIYPNSALEVFGDGCLVVADGAGVLDTNLYDVAEADAFSLLGTRLHVLTRGCTFNFDRRSVEAPAPADRPFQDQAQKAAF